MNSAPTRPPAKAAFAHGARCDETTPELAAGGRSGLMGDVVKNVRDGPGSEGMDLFSMRMSVPNLT